MDKKRLGKNTIGILILAVIGAIILTALFVLPPKGAYVTEPVDPDSLPVNEINIELIGEESQMPSPDFYLLERADRDTLFCDIGAPSYDDVIYLFTGGTKRRSPLINCDVMTAWDEKITSIVLDLSLNNYINGRHIVPVYNKLPIVNIEADKEEFNEMKGAMEKGITCSALIMTEQVPQGIEGSVRGRGNTTWTLFAKKPYTVETERSYNTFGLGKQRKWNFLANAHDKTLLKNEVWFDLARRLELPYTPESELVNLFVNEIYVGVYEITTKVKQDDTFLPLASSDYLVNIGGLSPEQRVEFTTTNWFADGDEIEGQPYADVVYPKDIGNVRKEIITAHLNDLFAAIDGTDDESLDRILDLESFAKLYWIEEISMNVDASARSLYIYWDDSRDKFFAGPIWDMDYTIGSTIKKSDDVDFSVPDGWKIMYIGMWNGLMHHDRFRECAERIYNDYDLSTMLYDSISLYKERSKELIPEANLDYMEHIDEEKYYELDRDFTSYTTYTNDTIQFYQERADWIKDAMKSGIPACQ